MDSSTVLDTSPNEDLAYTYDSERAEYDPDKDEDFFGFTLDHTDVGAAADRSLYFQPASKYKYNVDIETLRIGHIVRLEYKGRQVKTPFRVALIRTGSVTQNTYDSYNRDGTMTRTVRPYMALLDPINNTTQPTLIGGRKAEENDFVSINIERKTEVETTTVPELADHLDELISEECPDNPQEVVRQYPHGEIKNDARLVKVASDQTIARIFKINTPLLFLSEL